MKKSTPRNESLAFIDDLTSIYNRRYLKKRQKDIEEFRVRHIPYSVVIVDIDRFKEINDTYGHARGDTVIVEFSQFLKSSVRSSDIVVRYGGDEFVCVMPNSKRSDAELVYNRILQQCKGKKFGELDITVSAGIASHPDDAKDFNTLLKIADEALYDAKRSGGSSIGSIRKKRVEIPTKVFVGRRREKDTLVKFLTKRNGAVRATVLEGNVGIGKTRLLREVLNTIRSKEILWSDCVAFFEKMSYYPIRELIKYKIVRQGKTILKDMPLAYRIEIGKLIPDILDERKKDIEDIGLVLDRYRLYESVRKILEMGRLEKIIVIDNMQWVDTETTEIIKYLLRSLRNNRTTFIFIYREEEKPQALDDFISYISRETEVKEVEVEPFGYTEIREMIKLIIGEDPENGLVQYVEQSSGGNPFYIEEIIKALLEMGHLKAIGEHWSFEKPETELVPKSIEDITERKYQSLSNEGREILEIASVIGKFDVEIIKRVTEYNEGHIIGILDTIKRVGLLKERGDSVEFQDESSRSAIYKKHVTGMRRKMFHKTIADNIEEHSEKERRSNVAELAFHYYRGGDKEKAVYYCSEAGNRAKEKYANSNAIRYYTWTEELLRDERGEEKVRMCIDCLANRAEVLMLIGNNKGAMKDLGEGLRKAHEIGDRKREVDMMFKRATVYFKISEHKAAVDEAKRCMEIYKDMHDQEGTGKVLRIISGAYWNLGEYEKALKHCEEALSIFRAIKNKRYEARVLNNIGIIYGHMGDYHTSLRYFEDSLKITSDLGDKFDTVSVLPNIGNIYMRLGKYDDALQYYKDAQEIAIETGDRYREASSLNNMGIIYKNIGDYDQARTCMEESLKIAREIGNKYDETLALHSIGTVYMNLGDYKRALQYHEDARTIAKETGNRYNEAFAIQNIGDVYLNLGNVKKARKYLEKSLKIAQEIRSQEPIFSCFLSLGELHLALHEIEDAQVFIDKAYNIAKKMGLKGMLRDVLFTRCNYCLEKRDFREFEKSMKRLMTLLEKMKINASEGAVDLLWGCYYTEQNDFKKAEKHLRHALQVFRGLNERFNMAKTYYYQGMLALTMQKKSVCQNYLNKAMDIFVAIGAHGWQEKIKKTKKKIKPR